MESIKKISVTEQVIEELKKYLLSGTVPKGGKLPPEKELSEMLGVGRSSVREALRTLCAMGYVELKPGRGAFAAITSEEVEMLSLSENARNWFKVNRKTLDEFSELRSLIEPCAAEKCADKADDKTISELSAVISEFERLISYGATDSAELAAADREFHLSIIKNSGNGLMYLMYAQLGELFRQYSSSSFGARPGTAASTLEEHRDIFDAIKERNGKSAAEAMRRHLESAKKAITCLQNQ